MKRIPLILAILLSLLLCSLGTSSPTNGKRLLKLKIGEFGNGILKQRFRGGERACVVVEGDHNPVVNLGLFVYDEKDNLITKDDGGGDIVAVTWYPPRDAEYKIKIQNPGKVYNECYVALR